ncbi:hypothetical protein BJV78DRAFT_1244917 [Lactifluus subvellereus]|nr:hypothetical protein BJV78DRAFT_1244917 [Lactifluus subvellereus]
MSIWVVQVRGKDNAGARMDSMELEVSRSRARQRSVTGTQSHRPRANRKSMRSISSTPLVM